jgi:DNA primase
MSAENTQLIDRDVSHKFSQYLLANEPAMEYLDSRGIKRSLIEEERVGFCPPFLNYWWPLLRGRITTPIENSHGDIVAFAGRQYEPCADIAREAITKVWYKRPDVAEKIIDIWDRAKWINEHYPKTRHLYNLNYAKSSVRERGYIILVEGYFDTLVLSSKGLTNVSAICGTSLSERQAVLISRYCDNVVLLLDGDVAGEKGSINNRSVLDKMCLKNKCIYLPAGYDPDEFVLKVGGKQLRGVIERLLDNEEQTELKLSIKE